MKGTQNGRIEVPRPRRQSTNDAYVGEQIAKLKEKDSDTAIFKQNAVEEYEQFEQFLNRLETSKSTVDN